MYENHRTVPILPILPTLRDSWARARARAQESLRIGKIGKIGTVACFQAPRLDTIGNIGTVACF